MEQYLSQNHLSSIQDGNNLILFPIELLEIKCTNCKDGYVKNNLKCNKCKEKNKIDINLKNDLFSFSNTRLIKLNNISIYEMEEIGIQSAISAENSNDFKKVFVDFENWYEENYNQYKNNNYVILTEVKKNV